MLLFFNSVTFDFAVNAVTTEIIVYSQRYYVVTPSSIVWHI